MTREPLSSAGKSSDSRLCDTAAGQQQHVCHGTALSVHHRARPLGACLRARVAPPAESMASLEKRAADSVVPPAARQRPGSAARTPAQTGGRAAGQAAGRAAGHAGGQTGDPTAGHGSGQPPAVTALREGRRKPSPGAEGSCRGGGLRGDEGCGDSGARYSRLVGTGSRFVGVW